MTMPILRDDDLVRILAAGGGMKLPTAYKNTDALVRFAAAARAKGARLVFEVNSILTVDDLVRIGAAGGGAVSFEWPK